MDISQIVNSKGSKAAAAVAAAGNGAAQDLHLLHAISEANSIPTSDAGSERKGKAFPCSTCGKGFARRSDLARHERIHSGIRPHVCEHPGCGKQFIQRSALSVHMRVHTGEKPHMCERCAKPFSDSSSLARHQRIHSGKRPYKCPYADCQKTFTRCTTLTRHQNHHTGTIEEAAAATAAALATRGGSNRDGRQRSDGEQYSNNGFPMSTLEALHQGFDEETNCRHGDLKPANILHFLGDGVGILKIADFGISKIHNNATYDRKETPSPDQRNLSVSPNSELAPLNSMHRHPGEYPYMNDSPLPGHLRGEYHIQSQQPQTTASFFNGMRPTSHPTGYGPPSNRRKVLRVLIKNKEHLACPDSGSEKNIMSETFAKEQNLEVRRRPKDLKRFELGSGKHVWSAGSVRASVELLGALGRKKRRFYIFPTCPVPLILGMSFLKEADILTTNRHMLESCPAEMSNISSLLWIGSCGNSSSPRNRMKCSLDGHVLDAVADTGSDLNLMSLKCAKREGFQIDRRREARRRIQVGDGTEAETIGQVYVHNLSLDWRKASTPDVPVDNDNTPRDATPQADEDPATFGAIFHVLPGLPCDVIFGRDLLEQTDAFNLCPDLLSTRSADKGNPFELNVLIDLGPVSIALRVLWRRRQSPTTNPDPKNIHDDARHAEMFRRSEKEDEIGLLPVEQQHLARATERIKIRDWDTHHGRRCMYCNPV